ILARGSDRHRQGACMSDEAEKPAEGAEAPKAKSKLPLIGSGVVVLVGAVVALWYLGIGPFKAAAPKHAEANAAIEEEAGGEGEHGAAKETEKGGAAHEG